MKQVLLIIALLCLTMFRGIAEAQYPAAPTLTMQQGQPRQFRHRRPLLRLGRHIIRVPVETTGAFWDALLGPPQTK